MTANLNNDTEQIITGNDNVVIRSVLDTILGGRTLDVTGFSPAVINAGHVLVQDTTSKVFKPMPVIGTGAIASFGALSPGSGYTNDGTYTGVSLTGGSGTGAKGTIVVTGGKVTSATITTPGAGYKQGDSLSAAASAIGTTGTGFAVIVATTDANASAYGTLPSGTAYAGILIGSILTAKPFAGILIRGTVNPAAAPFDMTSILSAVKTALPLIDFKED